MTMRLTFLLPGRGFSGGIRCSVRMATELLQRGHDVQILWWAGTSALRRLPRAIYQKYVVKSPPDWLARFEGKSAPFKRLSDKVVDAGDFLVSIGPDCVEAMMKLPAECGRKVFYAHGLTLRNSTLRKIAWSGDLPKIAVSNYVKTEMLNAGSKGIVGVVPNGIDTTEYFPDADHDKRDAVGTVYAPGTAKDPETIISVLGQIHQLRPETPLVCFGSYPRPTGLSPAVKYIRLPSVEEAGRLYSRCKVWFCASRSEGFGMPILEAMASGCAVVSTNCGGPTDFITSDVNAMITQKSTVEAIVNEIFGLLDDNAKRQSIARQAVQTAGKTSWASAALKMEQMLQKIASETKTEMVNI